MKFQLSRRGFLTGASVAGSSLALGGCDVFDGFARNGSSVRNVPDLTAARSPRSQAAPVGLVTPGQP